jgi:hypothetical protein
MNAESNIRVVTDEPVEGLSERLSSIGEVDVAAAAGELRRQAVEAGLPLPGGRGVPEAFGWIVSWLKGRELVDDLGEHPAGVPWLSVHVPPGGSTSLSLQHRQQNERGLKLTVMGSGFGSGREFSLDIDESYNERDRCMQLIHFVDLHLRRYRGTVDGQELVEVSADLVRVRDTQILPWEQCPLCGTSTTDLDPFEFEATGSGFDLTHDDVGYERAEKFSLNQRNEFELTVPVSVPGVPAIKAGLIARRAISLSCAARFRFPGRRHFTPLRKIGETADLPFWGIGPWPSSTSMS